MIQPYSIDSTGARFWRRVAQEPFPVTEQQIREAKSGKAVAIIWMRPEDFLYLTTTRLDNNWAVEVGGRPTAPLDIYARATVEKGLAIPSLSVEIEPVERYGWVTTHEGRHRAAAVAREHPGARIAIAINVRKGHSSAYYEDHWGEGYAPTGRTMYGIEQVPKQLVPQTYHWRATDRLPASEMRTTPVKLGMDEFKDALEPWRMTS